MKTTVATMYGGKLRIRTAAMVNASMDGSRPCGTAGNRRWFGRQERETAGQTRDGEEFWNSVSLSMCDLQATVWAWAEVAVQIPSSLRTLGRWARPSRSRRRLTSSPVLPWPNIRLAATRHKAVHYLKSLLE